MALQLQTSCKPKQNTRKVVVQVKTKPLSMSAPIFLSTRIPCLVIILTNTGIVIVPTAELYSYN